MTHRQVASSRNQFAQQALITVGCLAAWRILAAIPIPFVTRFGPERDGTSVVAMGLNALITAFVIFFLVQLVLPDVRRFWRNQVQQLVGLAGLTAVLAFLQAYGIAILFERQGTVRPSATTLVILALTLGTMILFGLGVIIDRFGLPQGYGLWFLFAALALYRGFQEVGAFIQADLSDPSKPTMLLLYAVGSVLLLASAVVVREFFAGGVVAPVALAGFLDQIVVQIVSVIAGSTVAVLALVPTGPNLLADVFFNCLLALAVLVGCFFTMFVSVERSRLRSAVVPTGIAAGWLVLVAVVAPLLFRLVLGFQRPRLPLGGLGFALTALILVESVRRVSPESPLLQSLTRHRPARQAAPSRP